MLCSNLPFHFTVFLFFVNLSILAIIKAGSVECSHISIRSGEITVLKNLRSFNFLKILSVSQLFKLVAQVVP